MPLLFFPRKSILILLQVFSFIVGIQNQNEDVLLYISLDLRPTRYHAVQLINRPFKIILHESSRCHYNDFYIAFKIITRMRRLFNLQIIFTDYRICYVRLFDKLPLRVPIKSNQIKFIQSQTYIASNMGKHIIMQLQ